jgi:type I restriction enzyme M protein
VGTIRRCQEQALSVTQQDLISFIWSIANKLRGPYRPPQYRRVMIPMTVLRRLDCVLEPTKDALLARHAELKKRKLDDDTIERTLRHEFSLPFFNTSRFTFARLLGAPDDLAPNLVAFIKGFSRQAREILERFDFEQEVQRLDQANALFEVVKAFAAADLHPSKVPNTAMGYVFEDLVRRFNEQANEEAGDHFTPREVIRLMVHLLFAPDDATLTQPNIVRTLYDPCCGTGGMLTVAEEYAHREGFAPGLRLFVHGQEYNGESHAICGSDLMIKGEDPSRIAFGDTLGDGKSGDGFPDKRFHYMLANPPFGVEWKRQAALVEREHQKLGFAGRFGPGLPRINDGSLLFLLHMMSKMRKPEEDGTRIGIVFNGSPLFTGDAGSGESEIRRWIIENDWLEAIVGLPDQLFYNTGILTYVWIVTNRKAPARRGKVQLIDATGLKQKMRKSLGDKRNEMSEAHIDEVTRLYAAFAEGEQVRIFDNREFGYLKLTVERPLRLNFQASAERIARLQAEGAFLALAESRKRKDVAGIAEDLARGQAQQAALLAALSALDGSALHKSRASFAPPLNAALAELDFKPAAPLRRAILSALSERDPTADICREGDAPDGAPEPDAELRDTENVPLPPDFPLPAPIAYGPKADNFELLVAVQPHAQAWFEREVRPHVADAWVDWNKTRLGFEIPFNRHFYRYTPPRPLEDIESELKRLEGDIVRMLGEVLR